MSSKPPRELVCRPIGVVHSALHERGVAPHQPAAGRDLTATIELFPGQNYEHALQDLDRWPFLWVLFWFDRNPSWRPKVLPPRSTQKRGVFATRSPHRPNPIGLSVVRLVGIEGLRLRVAGVDMLDGTPVLDLKPYVAHVDAIDDAGGGWLLEDPKTAFEVEFEPTARAALDTLKERWGIELESRIARTLASGPAPHPYRRIKATEDGFVLALKDWRIDFRVVGSVVRIVAVRSGCSPRELADLSRTDLDPHRALVGAEPC